MITVTPCEFEIMIEALIEVNRESIARAIVINATGKSNKEAADYIAERKEHIDSFERD